MTLSVTEVQAVLDQLLNLPSESEIVEFKTAETNFGIAELGQYFSALSNEANLLKKPCGWLIFGVREHKPGPNRWVVVGSQFRLTRHHLDSLKKEIADQTTGRITFVEIYEVAHPKGRVVLFQIPAAPPGQPVAYKGHYYGRDNESLVALNSEEYDRIRTQSTQIDWSAVTVPTATLDDLDPDAIIKARIEYKKKHPKQPVDDWNNLTFLNKAKITINGQITHTALLLLGKSESTHYLSPAVAEITWLLKKVDGSSLDYEHFGPPFLVQTDQILTKIRNLRYRYLPDGTLFPDEIDMYDTYVIREALHNCLAHQDYTLCERIRLVEHPEHLIFENAGSFIPGSVEKVIEQDSPPSYYRNKFLADAMVNLDMIDTIGSGIRRMFEKQRERFFPMPDYDFSKQKTVLLRIEGKILDKNYSQLLRNRQLNLMTVIWLDKVQKHKIHLLNNEQIIYLKQQGLVEGRKPHIHISSVVAHFTGQEAEHIRNRAFNDTYYRDLIVEYIHKFGAASRKDIERLLLDKLSDMLSQSQKQAKISNLLTSLRMYKVIVNEGTDRDSRWTLTPYYHEKETKRI
jgi:ATP-dependent DNA helicase RecG